MLQGSWQIASYLGHTCHWPGRIRRLNSRYSISVDHVAPRNCPMAQGGFQYYHSFPRRAYARKTHRKAH